MPEPTTEMVALLREIRDLLLPVADAYRDEYERREAEREEQRLQALKALLSTDKKKRLGGSPTARARRPRSEKQRRSTLATRAGFSSPYAS